MFLFLVEKEALMILGPWFSQPLKVFLAVLEIKSPTPSLCGPSSLWPEKINNSPVARCCCPDWFKWVSLMPKIWSLFLCISASTWALFPTSYMVLTFHDPIRRTLGEGGDVGSTASSRLWLVCVMVSSDEESPSSPKTWFWILSVCVSLTYVVLLVRLLALPNVPLVGSYDTGYGASVLYSYAGKCTTIFYHYTILFMRPQ